MTSFAAVYGLKGCRAARSIKVQIIAWRDRVVFDEKTIRSAEMDVPFTLRYDERLSLGDIEATVKTVQPTIRSTVWSRANAHNRFTPVA